MSILDSLRPRSALRVLVTAGAGGVGAAIARAFHEAGSRVHVCDVDRSALDRLASRIPGITGSMADASVPADVDGVFDDVRGALGGLDVLVSNAGIAGPAGPIEAIDGVGWERTIAVNLHSQFYFARRAVPLLKRSSLGPCLIATGPMAAHASSDSRTACATSHWAVIGLMRSLAVELGAHGIRVNAILPRSVEDAGVAPAGAIDGLRHASIATRRSHTDHDVAALALFLCSPAARGLTGQAISVGASTA